MKNIDCKDCIWKITFNSEDFCEYKNYARVRGLESCKGYYSKIHFKKDAIATVLHIIVQALSFLLGCSFIYGWYYFGEVSGFILLLRLLGLFFLSVLVVCLYGSILIDIEKEENNGNING